MTCRIYQGVTICGGSAHLVRRHYRDCPTCERRTRFIQDFGGAWYASRFTCVRCGDSWCEGERGERPFVRGWRKAAIANARWEWSVGAVTPREFRVAVALELRAALAS